MQTRATVVQRTMTVTVIAVTAAASVEFIDIVVVHIPAIGGAVVVVREVGDGGLQHGGSVVGDA